MGNRNFSASMLALCSAAILSVGLFLGYNLEAKDKEKDKTTTTNTKIGFLELKAVFKDYKKVKEMEEQIQRESEAELAKIKGIEEEVKQLRDEIPLYKVGSKLRVRKETELTEKLFEIKHKKDKANYFFSEKMRSGIEQIYQEVVTEVEGYAEENGFFMIVRVADADFFGTQSADALKMEINTRDVLYWSQKDDITDKIISLMNSKYEASKGATSTPTSNGGK